MTDPITQVTMWQDAQGVPWPTSDDAAKSNDRNALAAFLTETASSGQVIGMETCDTSQLASVILASYTVTPIAAPAPSPAPAESPSPSPAPAPDA